MGGFYISAGWDKKNIYLITTQHVVLPFGEKYGQINNSQLHKDVMILSMSGFKERLAAINYEFGGGSM